MLSLCKYRDFFSTLVLNLHGILGPGCGFQAEVDPVDETNLTPLHLAAEYGQAAVAELLLQANASPTAVDKSGKTPADIAKVNWHPELAKRLLECQQGAASK